MNEFCERYAQVYDTLYADKDYANEAAYVVARLRDAAPSTETVLEFGSGTGRHARLLVEHGFTVIGVERSRPMLARAGVSVSSRLTFVEGDMRTTRVTQMVDSVIALFHVVGYLQSDTAIVEAFRNARRHLVSGGLFLFDFWYGPAVLTQGPETRVKEVESATMQVVRTARTRLDTEQGLARVDYTLFTRARGEPTYDRTDEVHTVRYLFLPELRTLLSGAGFRLVDAEEWLTRKSLSTDTWSAAVLAVAT